MKRFLVMATLGVLMPLFSGCATRIPHPIADTVGPAPSAAPTTASADGTLLVYSAYKRNADFDSSDPRRPEHSDYRILDANGQLVRKVHNITPTGVQDAVPVVLPPGNYQVVARANGHGYLNIPVLIEKQQCTVVHLEGGSFWPDESSFNETNSVRLPDGQIIGWRSAAGP